LKNRKSSSSKRTRTARSKATRKMRPLTVPQQKERVKCLAAINRVRRGEAKTVTAAARAEETTVKRIQALVPNTISKDRPRGRLRVKPSDRYSAKVEILANDGAVITTARGSGQRELAGQHRATYMRVLRGEEPKSALERYRDRKVGGHELLSDYEQLRLFARAGILGQLDTLYVSPDVSV
jgi:hypothetical protein